MTGVGINVNGRKYGLEVEPRTLLSDALRDGCGLTGTHVGCEHGVCGACTVLIEGRPVRSCLMLAVQADGQDVTTVEGLAGPDGLNPLQEAFRAEHGLQCGFCTPGILVTLTAHLADHPDATEAELRHAVSGNLCRCTGYQNVIAAAVRAARSASVRSASARPDETEPTATGPGETNTAPTGPAATVPVGTEPATSGPLGAAITRREDHRLLSGTATFVDDIALPGALHTHFVRSPHAHASIVTIDASAARGIQGVVGVFTGADLAAWTVPLRIAPPIDGLVPLETESLPTAKVRFVGDPVAVVVADSRYTAEDAAALVRVEYQLLQPALDLAASLEGRAPLVDETVDSNVVFREHFSAGDAATAFAGAHRVVRTRFSHQRMTHAPMETRGCAAVWDAGRAELTMYTGTQVPHPYRTQLAARLRLAEHQVRVIVQDVGGSFGQKLIVHREELAVAALARHLDRPVRWREDRVENLTAALSAREDSAEVETAVTADGRILAMRAHLTSDFGAYALFPANYMLRVVAMMLPNAYRLADYEYDMTVVLSNKIPASPMRAPMAICTWVTEGTIDAIARDLGLDPVEVRERNMLRESELPHVTAVGETYEDITPYRTYRTALDAYGYAEFRRRQRADRKAGIYRGLGIACLVEPTTYGSAFYRAAGIPGSGHESAWVRIDPSGAVVASVGIAPAGQGHETTIAQAVAAGLGVRPEDVAVRLGDTEVAPYGMGTRGARSGTAGGGAALLAAQRLKDKVLAIAREQLGISGALGSGAADESGLDVRDGEIVRAKDGGVVGTGVALVDIARTAYLDPLSLPPGMEPGLVAHLAYDPPPMTYSNAAHLCEVVVDPVTGQVRIERYLVAEDAGTMINPKVVEGQIHGAVMLGTGGVLYEGVSYDAEGNNLTPTFRDYVLPSAQEAPRIEVLHCGTPSSRTPGGMKGMSEGGVMGSIAAVTAAVNDAIAPFGLVMEDLPITAPRLSDLLAGRTAALLTE
ncbi:molybdopterin-dependent oxidoreductase [Actinacidiphila oryziradicis]|uniref:molybdopterin-dependent oxidoreductase n=1 Tax=Actinacidiphila oryziradicis TaxID=2571141 RepID=UPI0023F44D95|nr:molybdopterin-dependent oxidoreductase [Actinacidiphila oryziradicis]MCW2869726.1 molybdopterin-binding domain of aldehyde dehydrogenase family protein [Actinacidiphila oryziradicis]